MKAALLLRDKKALASGALIEMVIWKLPQPDPERPHGYKYRLYYGLRWKPKPPKGNFPHLEALRTKIKQGDYRQHDDITCEETKRGSGITGMDYPEKASVKDYLAFGIGLNPQLGELVGG